jgi:site-specific recombinase XerD
MIIFTAVFNYKSKPPAKKGGTSPIHICGYVKGQPRKYFHTQLHIRVEQWNEKANQVVNHPNSAQYNAEIRRQIEELDKYQLHALRQGRAITIARLHELHTAKDAYSFVEFWERKMNKNTRLAKETLKNHRGAYNHLVKFCKNVQFSQLTYDFVNRFDEYLYGQELAKNTVYTHHKQMKRYIKEAIKEKFFKAEDNPYIHFKPSQAPTFRNVLTRNEIVRWAALEFEPQQIGLRLVRDMFLFSCYTGLRYGDLVKLKRKDIEEDESGQLLMNLSASKTEKQLRSPLYKLYKGRPAEIADHYLKFIEGNPDDLLFRKISNQKYNKHLKTLAEKAEISKNVTSHVGRHTFGTDMVKRVPVVIVQLLMQHSKVGTTMIYVPLSSRDIYNSLDGVIEWREAA